MNNDYSACQQRAGGITVTNRIEQAISRYYPIWVIVLCATAFNLAYFSPNFMITDTHGSLLTSQAILQHGSLKLDAYGSPESKPYGKHYQFITKNGSLYYYFPIGTSLFSLPFVWLANLRGDDMLNPSGLIFWENIISSICVTVIFHLTQCICICYVNHSMSLLFTVIFGFGSSLISTTSQSLWSSDFCVVFILFCLLLLSQWQTGKRMLNPYAYSLFSFSAYLCRPTASIFIVSSLVFITGKDIRTGIRLMISLTVMMGVFIGFSVHEWEQILPDYYITHGLNVRSWSFVTALIGHCVSPARGLFIYSPHIFMVSLLGFFFIRRLVSSGIAGCAVIWVFLHWIVISSFPHWWGGYAFGSRLCAEAIPGFLIIWLAIWKQLTKMDRPVVRFVSLIVFCLLGTVSIFINTYQGLFNNDTITWNWNPNIDQNPSYLFDWRFPQFMASPQLSMKRLWYHSLKNKTRIQPDHVIGCADTNVLFENWYDVETLESGESVRWSKGAACQMVFLIQEEFMESDRCDLEIFVGFFRTQIVHVFLNDHFVDSFSGSAPGIYRLTFHTSMLEKRMPNVLEFRIPYAASPSTMREDARDDRLLGIGLRYMKIRK